jgi:hypothetical protein
MAIVGGLEVDLSRWFDTKHITQLAAMYMYYFS